MAESETLKEFLISLGFKVDETQQRKFDDGVKKSTSGIDNLALKATAATAAVIGGLEAMSREFEQLYYQSQRSDATVAGLRSIEYAGKQIGLSIGSADSAIANLASRLRNQPGLERYLNGIGVTTRDASGNLRDMSKVMIDLVGNLKDKFGPDSGKFAIGAQIAGMFGINSDDLYMMERNYDKLKSKIQEQSDIYKMAGVDQDGYAKKAMELGNHLDEVTGRFDALTLSLKARFMPVAEDLLKYADKFLIWAQNMDKTTHGLSTAIGGAVLAGVGLSALSGMFRTLGLSIGGAAGKAGLLSRTLGLITKGAIYYGLADMAVTAADPDDKFSKWMDKNVPGAGWLDDWSARHIGVGRTFDQQHEVDPTNVGPAPTVSGGLTDLYKYIDKNSGPMPSVSGGLTDLYKYIDKNSGPVPGFNTMGVRNNNPGNLRQWEGAGTNGGFAVFKSASEGIEKMVINLMSYAKHGLNTVDSIISTWAPKTDHNQTQAYINYVAKQLGVKAGDKLNVTDPRVMQALVSSIIHQENGGDPYSSSLIGQVVNAKLGASRPVNLAQTNNFNINGATDPAAVASKIAANQREVGHRMVTQLGVPALA